MSTSSHTVTSTYRTHTMEHLNIPLPEDEAPYTPRRTERSSCRPSGQYQPSGGGSHRRFGGGCPVHGAPSPPLGCAPADGNPAGGAATSAPALVNQKLSELLAEMLRLWPRRIMHSLTACSSTSCPGSSASCSPKAEMADTQALGTRAIFFAAHNNKRRRFSSHHPPLCPSF